MAFLSVLFIALVFAWIFLNVYTPGIGDAPGLPDWGDWGLLEEGMLVEDYPELMHYMDGLVAGEAIAVDRRQGDSYTFLIIGRNNDLRTNTIMFWHFNVRDNNISLLSIPRDSWINIDGLFRGRINSAFMTGFNRARNAGRDWDDATADGIRFLRQVLGVAFGLQIDRHIFVDLRGFKALVDAVGGVEIYVPIDMRYSDPYQDLHINLRRGLQTLDGDRAEQFVRFRNSATREDIGRIARQQTFMAALIRQMTVFDMAQIGRIWDVAATYVNTTLSAADMAWFAARALNVRLEDIVTHTLPGEPASVGPASVWSLHRAESMQMINEYYNPFLTDIPSGNFNIFEISRRHANPANSVGVTMAERLGN